MFWNPQQTRLPAVAALLAFAIAACGETTRQTTPQPPAPGPPLSSLQVPSQNQAGATPPAPAVAGQPQASSAPASPAATPEEHGDALMAQQHYQAAIEAYKNARRSADVWNKMGIAYQLMFNLVEATHCYQASIKMDAKNPRVLNNMGTIYDAQKQYGDAERLYHKALKLDPKSALILKNLGTNLLAQRRYKKGWEAYKTALEIDPGIFQNTASPKVQNPTSLEERGAMNYYMARGCVRAGMNDCAIEYLRAALNEGFTNPKKIQADGEFAGLLKVPAFQELLASQRQQ
jgi:tetratricopeptide (TPR) repeat protein